MVDSHNISTRSLGLKFGSREDELSNETSNEEFTPRQTRRQCIHIATLMKAGVVFKLTTNQLIYS